MRNKKIRSILVIRNDGIGDFILTLPAIRLLKKYYKDSKIILFAKDVLRPIADDEQSIDGFIPDRNQDSSKLSSIFKKAGIDMSVHFITNIRTMKAAFNAKIPVRIGPAVHIQDKILLNKSIRQRRSKCIKNEAVYNIELLQLLNIPSQKIDGSIRVPMGVRLRGDEIIEELGIKRAFVIIHPGMNKSALNWNIENYKKLAEELKQKQDVVISLGPSEQALEIEFKKVSGIFILNKNLNLAEYISFISKSRCFIGPSTGPTHLAAALGIKTIGIYSPVKVHRPERWGFYNKAKNSEIMPEVDCKTEKECIGKKCKDYYCMDKIKVEDVLKAKGGSREM